MQIGGPTGAFVVIVYGIVQQYGMDGLTVATLMAGVILVVMGLAGFGDAIRFIPHPLVTGFTSGIAVIIFTSEVKDFFGLRMGPVPVGFLEKWRALAAAAPHFTPAAVGVGVLAMGIILAWPRVSRRIPGTFVALVATTLVVAWLRLPVETIGTRFGDLAPSVPRPEMPHLSAAQVAALVGPAFTIAILAAIESLLSAVVADGMIGGQHRPNTELVAQGVANLVTPLFGGMPATGAIARTATNVKNGGRTPVAGIVHSLTLLLITLFVGRWASLIPMATLAAILFVVAFHMSEWRAFVGELHSPKSDVVVLLTTFTLTLLVDLSVAIGVGMVLAAFLFIRRMATVAEATVVTRQLVAEAGDHDAASRDDTLLDRATIPRGVEVYEINGPLFFGAAARFKDTLARIAGKPTVLVLRMRHVSMLDSSGMRALTDVVHRTRGDGTAVILSDVHMQPLVALTGTPTLQEIGSANVVGSLDLALARAREILATRAAG